MRSLAYEMELMDVDLVWVELMMTWFDSLSFLGSCKSEVRVI
jgi:hypothetical protein